ncbi:DUF3450 domain-containing protein [Psychromonas hadalis]|uniref:DUF3450 domain-containing protein n=1 Tax=Psychromonas hadalis TaxID=211669 RepID=UPI00040FF8E4|nr:DUF3450 domain-containing protein [Psychromonas hadalis]
MSLLKIITPTLLLLCFSSVVYATDVEKLQKNTLIDQRQSQQAQLKINQLDTQKIALIELVKSLQAEAQSLEVYNQYLGRLLADQANEKRSLNTQISSVTEIRQGLVPLMMSMLENLQAFIELDSPMLITERQARLLQLQNMMQKADVSDAEKFRRLLTAYHIEAEYGRKMGQYQGNLTIEGVVRTVNYFYLGRVVFVAVSLDSKSVWLWDRDSHHWLTIDASYARDINQAIRIAKKTDIPALLKLPLLNKVNG